MDLILRRHAQAEPAADPEEKPAFDADMKRALTGKGRRQAKSMAQWLDRRLPEDVQVLVSPARRCEQTARALTRKYRLCAELAPDTTPEQICALARWPDNPYSVLLIGHQPTLGHAAALALGLQAQDLNMAKAGVWWLRSRERSGNEQRIVVAVQSPELL